MAVSDLNEEKLNEKMRIRKRPANCPTMVCVPKVNSELWSALLHEYKSADLKLQRNLKISVKVAHILLQLSDTHMMRNLLPSDVGNSDSEVRLLLDALQLVMKLMHDLNMDRRARILQCPTLNPQCRRLASSDVPVTHLLFGDDMKSSLQSIATSSKLRKSQTWRNRQGKTKNWDHGRKPKYAKKGQWTQSQRGKGRYHYQKAPGTKSQTTAQ
jgi:hypothetical protein